MKTVKIITVTAIFSGVFVIAAMVSATARSAGDDPFDAAGTYKTKCQACHGAKAEKKFDPAKPDAEHVQVTLKGKKMEKPPNMPGYEEKGMSEEQAKAMIAHIRTILQQ